MSQGAAPGFGVSAVQIRCAVIERLFNCRFRGCCVAIGARSAGRNVGVRVLIFVVDFGNIGGATMTLLGVVFEQYRD